MVEVVPGYFYMITSIELIELYGIPTPKSEFLTYWKIPNEILWTIDGLRNPYKIKGITCHKIIKEPLHEVFREIGLRGLDNEIKTYNGCFNIRQKRGQEDNPIFFNKKEYPNWSTHSWALSIDINEVTNRMNTKGDIHPEIIKIFQDNGFDWGGDFNDPMHFQASKELIYS